MKLRPFLLASGLLGAAWLAYFGDKTADNGVVAPVIRTASTSLASVQNKDQASASSEAARPAGEDSKEIHILTLKTREEWNNNLASSNPDRQLFADKDWTPPPPLIQKKNETSQVPSPPPLPFSYVGKKISNGRMEVFLASGEEVWVVHEQMVIKNTYRVEAISPPHLTMLYLPLNQIQQLSIGVAN